MGKATLWLAVAVLLSGCGREYPKEVRSNFMGECAANGTPKAVCECTLEGLEKRYELGEFLRIEQEMVQGTAPVPNDMKEIVLSCQAKGG